MGRYRLFLVLFSFFVIYLDLFVNKQNSSFLVSLNVFFAMLLYDYEKMGKNSKGTYTKIVSTMGIYTFLFLVFAFLSLWVISLYGQLSFIETDESLLKLNVVIFSFQPFSLTIPLFILFLCVFTLTFLEIFSGGEKEKSKETETETVTNP